MATKGDLPLLESIHFNKYLIPTKSSFRSVRLDRNAYREKLNCLGKDYFYFGRFSIKLTLLLHTRLGVMFGVRAPFRKSVP